MMTKSTAGAIVDALVKLRNLATDEQAIEVPVLYPAWIEGIGYEVGERVVYNEVLYKVLTAHTSQADWTPDVAVSLFAKVLTSTDGTILEWVQPDSTNPYMTGDKVRYNGKVYSSTIDNNTWSPEAYPAGWKEVTE